MLRHNMHKVSSYLISTVAHNKMLYGVQYKGCSNPIVITLLDTSIFYYSIAESPWFNMTITSHITLRAWVHTHTHTYTDVCAGVLV